MLSSNPDTIGFNYDNFNSPLSEYVFDNYLKILYSTNSDQKIVESLSDCEKLETVVPLPTEFPLNHTHTASHASPVEEEKSNCGSEHSLPETLRFSRSSNSADISPSGLTVT